MTGDEQIQYVWTQMKACESGTSDTIHCPYCDSQNPRGSNLCCSTLAKCCMAIIERESSNELLDQAKRIQDKAVVN